MDIEQLIRACIEKIPPYIPGKPIEEVERELGLSGVTKMASNENPLGPSKEVRQAIINVLDKVSYYPDANNYYLKAALADEFGVDQDWLIVGSGLDDINRILAETILEPADEVVIPQPTFSMYQTVTLLMGAKPVLVKGSGLGNDLSALAAAVTEKTKLIFVCNPNNPTGTIVKQNELRQFLKGLPQNVLVVIDEAYWDFADDPDFPNGVDLLKEGFDNIIIYRTFSKIHGIAGLRLGFAVGQPKLIRKMLKVKDPFNVNLIAQTAGLAALKSKRHISLSKEMVRMGKQLFYKELDELGLEYLPTQANFILINWGRDSMEIYQFLLQNGIIVRPTHSFGLPNYFRVTFGTAEQNNRFFRVLREGVRKLRQ